jgi:hypothetical protein
MKYMTNSSTVEKSSHQIDLEHVTLLESFIEQFAQQSEGILEANNDTQTMNFWADKTPLIVRLATEFYQGTPIVSRGLEYFGRSNGKFDLAYLKFMKHDNPTTCDECACLENKDYAVTISFPYTPPVQYPCDVLNIRLEDFRLQKAISDLRRYNGRVGLSSVLNKTPSSSQSWIYVPKGAIQTHVTTLEDLQGLNDFLSTLFR